MERSAPYDSKSNNKKFRNSKQWTVLRNAMTKCAFFYSTFRIADSFQSTKNFTEA